MTLNLRIRPIDLLVLIVSPTRFLIERLVPKPIRPWNWIFRAVLAASLVGLRFKTGESVRHWPLHLGYVSIWFFPISRVNELAIAFYRDAKERFGQTPDRTDMTPLARLNLLVAAYFEVAAQFGILYYVLPALSFKPPFKSIIDAVYFSAVTITTVGYGDFLPQNSSAKFMCMYELGVGFIIIAFALGAYFATSLKEKGRT